jgi:hypothetical protein
MLYVRYVYLTEPHKFIRDKLNFSSEKMLHNDYESKDSVPKKVNLFVSLRGLDAKKN